MDVSGPIGVLGGTFDPVHYGHLVAAQEAAWSLGLERVLFVPTSDPPHKQDVPVSPAESRAEMVRLAIQDNPCFSLSTIELERRGPSYTVHTLRELRELYPGVELHFIVGMDSLAELASWYDPPGILREAHIAAVHRAGWKVVDLVELAGEVPAAAERVRIIPIPGLDISSTDLRARVASGRPIRYLTPEPVIRYIEEQGLYRR